MAPILMDSPQAQPHWLILAFWLLLAPSAFAYRYPPSRIAGLTVSNPEVGFHGYTITFPLDFIQGQFYRSAPPPDTMIKNLR
jgi:hypothetical protein